MMWSDSIISLNYRAVAHLKAGNVRQAKITLRQALQVASENIELFDEEEMRSAEDKSSFTVRASFTPLHTTKQSPVDTTTASTLSIFDQAILFEFDEPRTLDTLNLASAMILYNFGLTCHIEGLRSNDSILLKKCLKAYHMAYISILECSGDYGSVVVKEAFLLQMALSNNMGHIHSYFYNIQEAEACIRSLRSAVNQSNATSTTDDSEMTLVVREDYILFFFMNAVLFAGNDLRFAPAA